MIRTAALPPTSDGATAGTRLLLRLALRRDRLFAPLWLAALLLVCLASAAATPGLYPDEAVRVRAAEALNASPAIVALYGPVLDTSSVGELAMTKMTVLYAVFVSVLFIALIRRHTRVEEESGRAELVASAGVGRYAPLAAGVLEGCLLAVILGVLTATVNTVGGLDPVGSIVFGGVWAGTALVAVGVGAVTAQLAASARTCAAYAAATVGAFFVLRAIGDTGPGWVSWLSPLGWNTQVSSYSGPRWGLLVLYPLLAAVLLLAAWTLRTHRDLAAGLIVARPGPPTGSPRLEGALTVALRVHATSLVLWTAACVVLGALFGMIVPGIGDLLDSTPAQAVIDKLGGALVAAILAVLAVVVTYFASTVIAHARSDEQQGRAEMVLSTAVSRPRWFLATMTLAVAGTAWLLAATGAAMWVGYAIAGGPGVGNIWVAALGWAPAVWVVVGLSGLCLAVRPAAAAAAWAWPAGFLVLTLVVDLLDLPGWLGRLSPYSHVPGLPAARWDWGAELALAAVAAVLLAAATAIFTRRDVGSG